MVRQSSVLMQGPEEMLLDLLITVVNLTCLCNVFWVHTTIYD